MKIAAVIVEGQRRAALQRESNWYLVSDPRRAEFSVFQLICEVSDLSSAGAIESWLDRMELEPVELARLQFKAPLDAPEKVICIGKNYEDHAREMDSQPPDIPIVFGKFSSAIIGPGDAVVLPALSQQVDYEAELVVVMGRSGRNIPRAQALNHVFGYTAGNDISARDWQKGRPGGQWLLGKTFDTFAPIGPWIVTADELGDPHDLEIRCELNGKTMQNARTDQLIFRVDYLISHLSDFFQLNPGDLIFTGTPAGVGAGRTPEVFLKPGDELKVYVENIGFLHNRVV